MSHYTRSLHPVEPESELAGKIRKELSKFFQNETETLDQTQLLKDLEQLKIAKHLMRGIRFANFYQVLKGEEPRRATTEKFEAEKWLAWQAEKEVKWKEREKERLGEEGEKGGWLKKILVKLKSIV